VSGGGRTVVRGILAGGQSGVDRAALDVALDLGIPCGGWCPAGRWAEDGPIAERYPLRETPLPEPEQRTVWNVFDADATLVLTPGAAAGGSALAITSARRWGRPFLQVDPTTENPARVRAWLNTFAVPPLLGIGGPRASEWSDGGRAADSFLRATFIGSAPVMPGTSPSETVLVTGGAGLLGRHLTRYAPPFRAVHSTWRNNPPPRGTISHRIELSDAEMVLRLLRDLRPGLVIHTAYGMQQGDRDIVAATRAIVDAALDIGSELVHISSDMVLNGRNAPFDESAEAAPVHEYGRWKAEAEGYVRSRAPSAAIVRASLITTLDPPDPRTEWLLRGLRGEQDVALFTDEIRSPILAEDLARQVWEIARLHTSERGGVWNLAAPESLSRFGIGLVVAAAWGYDAAPLRPVRSSDAAGPRPRDLRLTTARADRMLPTRPRAISAAAADQLRRMM
jgi:dTDP-4-dehydrorhamnose reductase